MRWYEMVVFSYEDNDSKFAIYETDMHLFLE